MRKLRAPIFIVILCTANIANASIFNEIPVLAKRFASFFKKNADDVIHPTSPGPHLNDSTKLTPSGPGDVAKPLNDIAPYNLNSAAQLGKCAHNKLKADPKLSPHEAENFCKRAFYSCISEHKNNFGFNDSKCLAAVNEGKAYSAEDPNVFRKQ